ncbi:hypothetical protein TNCV_2426701 [Trichonephila clavipes]|nr:hypothetical protein TNCV_2426701 [Trichonephila clavipes]
MSSSSVVYSTNADYLGLCGAIFISIFGFAVLDVFRRTHLLLGFTAWDTEDVIIDGKLLDVEVVGSDTERLVKVENMRHVERESVDLMRIMQQN